MDVRGSVSRVTFVRARDVPTRRPPTGGPVLGQDGMDAGTRLIDAHRLAESLGMPVRTVYGLAARGALPHHRIGRTVRFDLDEVLRTTRSDDPDRLRSRGPRRSPAGRSGSSLRGRMQAIERGRLRAV